MNSAVGDYLVVRGDAARIPLPDRSVDLCVGSPPYADARTYLEDGRDLGIARGEDEWIDWMLIVTAEALRVTAGAVIWVVAGPTRDRDYWPIGEGLCYRWRSEGWGECGPGTYPRGSMYRPVYWHRVGIPGSGRDQWFRHDVESCLCFKRPGPLPWADNTACGHPPKWGPGGEMSIRVADADRRNQWGRHLKCRTGQRRSDGSFGPASRPSHRTLVRRRLNGNIERSDHVSPVLVNPGNLIHTSTGGGQLGHPLAHANEASYPVVVPTFFVASLCPPGGLTLDPFSGSGSTCEAVLAIGRRAIGLDLRMSQCRIARRRLDRPHAPVARTTRPEASRPLFDPPDGRDECGR